MRFNRERPAGYVVSRSAGLGVGCAVGTSVAFVSAAFVCQIRRATFAAPLFLIGYYRYSALFIRSPGHAEFNEEVHSDY